MSASANIDRFLIMPSFSLQPNKLVAFNRVFRRDRQNERLLFGRETVEVQNSSSTAVIEKNGLVKSKNGSFIANQVNIAFDGEQQQCPDHIKKLPVHFAQVKPELQIQRKSHNFTISENAYRTLKQKINWLYYLSKSRYQKTYNGREIYNFKINFITLTLPTLQLTPTKECTSALLNTFLTEIRQRTKMENYVWRLEFQKNGNVHYHIVTDTYLDYFFCLKIWNRILDNNGYIQPYTDKMQNLSLSEYNQQFNSSGKTDFSEIAKRYAKGKTCGWSQPNTVDVKSVISKKAISNYISKYFSKDASNGTIKNELDNEENSENMRLWYCSRSLSKLKSISNFCEAVEYDLFAIVSYCDDKKTIFTKYAKIIYFEITSMIGNARKWIEMLLKKYALDMNYVPAT